VIEDALRKLVPVIAIRELVANALIRQDFRISGTSMMVEIYLRASAITDGHAFGKIEGIVWDEISRWQGCQWVATNPSSMEVLYLLLYMPMIDLPFIPLPLHSAVPAPARASRAALGEDRPASSQGSAKHLCCLFSQRARPFLFYITNIVWCYDYNFIMSYLRTKTSPNTLRCCHRLKRIPLIISGVHPAGIEPATL
jgi:hypothetical protein